MQNQKADQLTFDLFIESTNQKMQDLKEYTELNRNMVHGCENYLEKYQPLFNQRQINEALEYVNTNVKAKWRAKKFGDAKNEHYTRKILQDDGKPDLPGHMEKTRKELRSGQSGTGDDSQDKQDYPGSSMNTAVARKTSKMSEVLEDDSPGKGLDSGNLSAADQQNDLSGGTTGRGGGDELVAQEAAGDGDLESQVTKIVGQTVAHKAGILEEKLKYWHDEVDKIVETKFNE